MKRLTPLLILFASLSIAFSCGGHRHGVVDTEEPNDTIPPLGFLTDTLRLVDGAVKNGSTFNGLMTSLGMSSEQAYKLFQACDSIFDVRKLRAGNNYHAYYTLDSLDSKLHYLVYDEDRIHQTIFRCFDSLAVWKYDKPVKHVRKRADVTIHSSLWNDMLSAGASPLLIIKLADIFAWTVDFFGLQRGDRFNLIYSQTECEGELISIDTIYYCVFTNDEKEMYSIMFDQGDGGNIYWNEKGESMRKAFLKAPLQFTRISSGFSYHRKHPVTGQVKAHTAVDYAAPTGTPVMSIGAGTVISVGWAGGGGNTVKVRHNSVYTTSYMHLSKYAKGLKVGQRVQQGEVIGYVGATGTATGPHLDFRVYQNGTAINPLKMESPSEEPIKEEYRAALDSVFAVYRAELEATPAPAQLNMSEVEDETEEE